MNKKELEEKEKELRKQLKDIEEEKKNQTTGTRIKTRESKKKLNI